MDTFGERLRDARRAKRLSQKVLATRVGTTGETISRYENGRLSPPRGDMMGSLAGELGVTVGWLMGQDVPREGSRVESEPVYPSLVEFLASPVGRTVTTDELAVLASYRGSRGDPSPSSYQYLLQAIRAEIPPPEAAESAEATERAMASAKRRGGRVLED